MSEYVNAQQNQQIHSSSKRKENYFQKWGPHPGATAPMFEGFK